MDGARGLAARPEAPPLTGATAAPETFWETAGRVCTERQLQILAEYQRTGSVRATGLRLGIARSTVRDHLDAIRHRVQTELDRQGE